MTNIGVRHFGLLAAVLAAACSSAPPPQTAPTAVAPADMQQETTDTEAQLLTPPASAVAAAEAVQLTGIEMGTMWTFENPPLDYWEETYGFRPTAEWLEHVRLSTVQVGGFCSGAFISPNGLAITNHHCARGCVDQLSTEEEDYLLEGFYAANADEEQVCPGLFLDQLVEIMDVTSEVHGAAQPGMTDSEIGAAQGTVREQIVEGCESDSELQCEVVSLYHGGQYQLYKYRRFQPVKLVFAPELQAGAFGGSYDNWAYPRYDLDMAILRAFEADGVTPAATEHYLKWNPDGPRAGEVTFVTGYPGGTSRQIPVSSFMYERQARHPIIADGYSSRLAVLHEIAEMDPVQGRALAQLIFGLENAEELYIGQLAGLRDTLTLARKIKWENEFRGRVEADASLSAEYGDVWDQLAAINEEKAALYATLSLHDSGWLAPAAHAQVAGLLVTYVNEMARPESERSAAFRGERLEQTQGQLRGVTLSADYRAVETFAGRLAIAQNWLPEADPLVRAVRPGETPQQAATRLIEGSRIGDPAFRAEIMDGGPEALQASTDALLALVAEMAASYETVSARWSELLAAENVQAERFAAAFFAVFGTGVPPDATSTLRISDGVMTGYEYNGTLAPEATTIYGLYARAAEFDERPPFDLAPSFAAKRDAVDMGVKLNFVSTHDTTGGNSGSPLIDKEGRYVGALFDGNTENFPNEFLFGVEGGRSVSVHSAGITEALSSVYEADELLQEILDAAQ
jgi:hypothetical protein